MPQGNRVFAVEGLRLQASCWGFHPWGLGVLDEVSAIHVFIFKLQAPMCVLCCLAGRSLRRVYVIARRRALGSCVSARQEAEGNRVGTSSSIQSGVPDVQTHHELEQCSATQPVACSASVVSLNAPAALEVASNSSFDLPHTMRP